MFNVIKDTHLIGKRVELIRMEGEPQMELGMKGVIENVDDINQYHVRWDNGSTLALIPNEDEFTIL
jgi:hypothetical protein